VLRPLRGKRPGSKTPGESARPPRKDVHSVGTQGSGGSPTIGMKGGPGFPGLRRFGPPANDDGNKVLRGVL
jgi:hypothetical protein